MANVFDTPTPELLASLELTAEQKIRAKALEIAALQPFPGNLGLFQRAQIFEEFIKTGSFERD